MEKISKKQSRTITRLIFSVTAVFCILSIIFIIWLAKNNEKRFFASYNKQQQLLVDIAGGEIKSAIDKEVTDNEADILIIKNILKKMYTSGSRYWIAAKDSAVVFMEDEYKTSNYLGKNIQDVVDKDNIISMKNFKSNNHDYEIVMSTDYNYARTTGGIDSLNIYLYLYTIAALIIFMSAITLLSLRIENLSMHITEDNAKIKEKNIMIESLSSVSLVNDLSSSVSQEKADYEENKRIDQNNSYRFKFYINASHSIYINGKLGERHPHTWEISIVVRQGDEMFIRFNKIEEIIEKFFAKYQDMYLNDIKPFDKVNPTLENISRYFNAELASMIKKIGWSLERMEVSETPARSYIIKNCD